MKHFLIVANTQKDTDLAVSGKIKSYIEGLGGTCIIKQRDATPDQIVKLNMEEGHGIECILVLGGDGTMVRAARDMTGLTVPMIGVNLGTLGYLCEVEEDKIFASVDRLMADDYEIENRIKLSGSVVCDGEQIKTHSALNDIVIYRAGNLQIVSLDLYVNGQFLCNYFADGLIISTPTGSTAYSMSAGGPIVDPKAELIVITPINAQALSSKSIVISSNEVLSVVVKNRRSAAGREKESVELAFDGDNIARITEGERIVIRRSPENAQFLKLSRLGFIERLQKKMDSYR